MKQKTICTYILGSFSSMGEYARGTLMQSPNTRYPKLVSRLLL